MISTKARSLIFMGDFLFFFIILLIESVIYAQIIALYTSISLLIVSIAGVIYLFILIKKIKKSENVTKKIKSTDDRTNLYVMYMISFISLIPLFIGKNWVYQLSIFGLIIFIIYTIYINSDLLFYNPILGIKGYKYFKITTEEGNEIFLIASKEKKIKANLEIKLYMITDYIFLYA